MSQLPCHAYSHLPIPRLLERERDPSLLQNASWTLSNLCRGKDPRPPQHLIFPALHMLYLLTHNRNEEILIGEGPSEPSFSDTPSFSATDANCSLCSRRRLLGAVLHLRGLEREN